MISILCNRLETSLVGFTENNLIKLTEKITPVLYKNFHNLLLDINDVNTTDIINNITQNHNEEIKQIKDKFIQQKEEFILEYQTKMQNMQNMHNTAIMHKENEKNFYQQQLEDVKNKYEDQKNNELFIYTNQIKTLEENLNNDKLFYQQQLQEIKQRNEEEVNYFKEQLKINQENLDGLKEDFFKKNSLTNIAKGDLGENRVYQAILDNPRYNDIFIEDTSGIAGAGDLVVGIPSIDIITMIEVKNETQIQKQKDIVQFENHYKEFFNQHSNAHAMFISLNTDRIPHHGSYNIINNSNNYIGYFSKQDMDKDHIKSLFYTFIDTIITNRNLNSKKDNTIDLCDNISKSTNLFNDIIDDYQKRIKYHTEEIKTCQTFLNKLNTNVKDSNNLLREEGITVNSSLVCKTKEEKIIELKNYLIQEQIYSNSYNKEELKSNWTKKSKEKEEYKKDRVLKKLGLPKSMSYENIYSEVSK
jgi:hypothetical protein